MRSLRPCRNASVQAVDANGIALAAIQELFVELQKQQAELVELRATKLEPRATKARLGEQERLPREDNAVLTGPQAAT